MYVVDAAECDLRGRKSATVSKENTAYPQREFWQRMLKAAASVDAASIIQSMGGEVEEIPRVLHWTRVGAVSEAMLASAAPGGEMAPVWRKKTVE